MFSRLLATRRAPLFFLAALGLLAFLLFRTPLFEGPPGPSYKAEPTRNSPIEDNFSVARNALTASDLPPVPSYNQQWHAVGGEPAPLLIGFTRNWLILQQCVVSYLAAGWPASSIYVIDNTGTMNSNRLGKLTLQNPFYLDYHRLTKVLGVNVLTTPTLQTFAQLQNFMMSTAIDNNWETYFWSHMDVAVLSDETFTVPGDADPARSDYSNLFARAVQKRAELKDREKAESHKWAAHWFAYDRLTLVNLKAYMDVGGWDPQIGYYHSDCDFHERLMMADWQMEEGSAGFVFNVATTLPDLSLFFRRIGWPEARTGADSEREFGIEAQRGDQGFAELRDALAELEHRKATDTPSGANSWQRMQQGGQGEPFYKDAHGFDAGLWWHVELGRKIFAEKWGYRDCNIRAQGLKDSDAWRVKHKGWWKVTVS